MKEHLHLHIIASGSKGNAAIVQGPEGSLLVDMGISRKKLLELASYIQADVTDIKAILLTHEHGDHTKGLKVFAKQTGCKIYATQKTATSRTSLQGMEFVTIGNADRFDLAGIGISTFSTSHDVQDPIGFRFELDGDAIGYCTDTGYLTDPARELLSDTRILAIEANHDQSMLASGPYPRYLKERIASERGHLSNSQTAQYLPELISDRTQHIIAMHLSEENNRPSLCVQTLAESIGALPSNSCKTQAKTCDEKITIWAAGQEKPLSIQ